MLIAVAGCVAQAEGREILASAQAVDLVVGTAKLSSPRSLVAEAATSGRGVVATDFPAEDKFAQLPARSRQARQPSAFITVQEGCDKFCTFCVVPYTRGAEYSRPPSEIVAEAERLAAQGAREITLLGQNVNAYHGQAPTGAPGLLPGCCGGSPNCRVRAAPLHHEPSARHGRRADRALRR